MALWLFNSNPKYYDSLKAFKELVTINWRQKNKIAVNDIIYLYAGKPIQKIILKAIVTKINVDNNNLIDDNQYFVKEVPNVLYLNYLELRLLRLYDIEYYFYNFTILLENGLKGNVRNNIKLDTKEHLQLKDYILKFDMEPTSEEYYQTVIDHVEPEKSIEDQPKKIPDFRQTLRIQPPRDPKVAKYAMEQAYYKCEIGPKHQSFISAITEQNFVEAHHLIPMEHQELFSNSLDVSANIISLCPTCHKKIHHATIEQKEDMVKKLYCERIGRLKNCSLMPTIDELLKFYK